MDVYRSDGEFLNALEACTLEALPHRDHVRAAWLYLRQYSYPDAVLRMCETLRRFARHHGVESEYHETITQAWMRLVCSALMENPEEGDFDSFVAPCPELLDRRALEAFYSPELIGSEAARVGWMTPDRQPLPVPGDGDAPRETKEEAWTDRGKAHS